MAEIIYEWDLTYEDMPSNEQRLSYLDDPYQRLVSVKDYNGVVLQRKYHAQQKTRAGLLQRSSEEDEVSEQ